uniref:Uncharacterized protein n=1 Tax=Amphimedon queenslandica TaxID=400682 RepID=A0A1X7TBL4_AMPQE
RGKREYYRFILKEAATLLEGLFTDPVRGLYCPPLSRPLAELDIMAHYNFDYAQQVHFPSNPLPPGPKYFLTPLSVLESAHWTEQVNQPVLPASRPTKFSPDWCFGLLKQRFRRSVVGSLHDLLEVVERSASVNKAQVVGTLEGECIVKSYDRTRHLAPFFKKIKAIKTFHHYVMDCQAMGEVIMRKTSDDPVMSQSQLRR